MIAYAGGWVSLGVGRYPEYEGSKDHQTVPLFSVHYQNRYLIVDLIGSEAYLGYSGQNFNLGFAADYNFGRKEIATGKGSAGVLSKLDAQFEPGLFIDWKLPVPGLSSEYRVELQNRPHSIAFSGTAVSPSQLP
jgi:outer membrane scaffolding protein for murein synthesis (MipA/OmpV family)